MLVIIIIIIMIELRQKTSDFALTWLIVTDPVIYVYLN